MKVLVTGATGFIGHALVSYLSSRRNIEVCASVRNSFDGFPLSVSVVQSGDIDGNTNWEVALADVDVVIHTAARAHVLNDDVADPISEFRSVNVAGTLNLAHQALRAGVTRFVFISSIGVMGIQSSRPFSEMDNTAPVEPYAVSKLEAEQGLREIADKTALEVVIVRPPLVYGPDAPGNFGRLIRFVYKGFPLPLGAIVNRRSFVALDNLVDFLFTCLEHPAAANETFHVADGTDISTPELLRKMGDALGKPVRLIPLPSWLLTLLASILGKRAEIERLCGSLQVDAAKAHTMLGWEPPVSLDQGLRKAVEAFTN